MKHPLCTLAAAAVVAAPLTAQQSRLPEMVSPGLQGLPDGVAIASENGDTSALLYRDTGDQSIQVRVADGRGLSWTLPRRLDDDLSGALKQSHRHSLVVDGDRVYAAWRDQRNGLLDDLYFTASLDGGATWSAANLRLEDGALPGADDVKDYRIAASGDDVAALISVGTINESLYLTWSNDGGASWSPAVAVTAHNGLADVDNIALACSGDVAYAVWRDNFLNGADDTVWLSAFDLQTGAFVRQDVDVSPNLILAGGDADDGVGVAVDQNHLAVIYHADGLGSTAEQLRVNLSSDLGATWFGDHQVGQYDNALLGHDADSGAVLVEDGHVAVAWADDRSGANQVYATVADFASGVFAADRHCSLSAASASEPRLAGEFGGEPLALSWSQFPGETVHASYYRNGVWSNAFVVSANTGDTDGQGFAWNDRYDNCLAVWMADDIGSNQVYAGGFRPAQVDPGVLAGGLPATLVVHGFGGGQYFQVVASGSPGSLLIPDGRDLGLTADNILLTSKDLAQLSGQLAADGTGATASVTVPPSLTGMTLYFVAGGFDPVAGITDLSDARPATVL